MWDIRVEFNKKSGRIKPLHGVNNGPVCYGGLVDVTKYYKEAGFPYIRLHDTNWPHPREVDIPQIFPDFEKDPEDPASYDFSRTDEYIQSVLNTGAQIIYRLGTSIEHTAKKYYVHPPKSFDKWAKICLGIIKHYNEGWAEGFHHNIQYWEIWNEPEGFPDADRAKCCMWTGTYEQYLELYKTASMAIKAHNPALKIGGPAYTMVNPGFIEMFVKWCNENNLSLDFFSYHTYAEAPDQLAVNSRMMKDLLLKYGFGNTECHYNEWNYCAPKPEEQDMPGKSNECSTQIYFERSKNHEGASFDAASLILLQDCPVEVANFYDGAPTSMWSMFNMYGVPQKAYYAFKAFNILYGCADRVETTVATGTDGLYCCAGADSTGNKGAVLISNFSGKAREYTIELLKPFGTDSSEGGRLDLYMIDEFHNLDLVESIGQTGEVTSVRRNLPKHSVLLMKLERS